MPGEVVVGIPAELLQRRPDIRAAERNAAAQAQQIGIAQANLYPHISITGTLGYSAQNASQLFSPAALNGSVGPTFQWNILNYGRISNNVRLQDAKFQQSLLDYRTSVLTANQEAEDGLIAFLKSQEQTKLLAESVAAADKAYQIGVTQYRAGRSTSTASGPAPAGPGPAAGPRGRGPWGDRVGPGPGLSGVGRRLGDPGSGREQVAGSGEESRTRGRRRREPTAGGRKSRFRAARRS